MTFLEVTILGAAIVGHTWKFVKARRDLRYVAGVAAFADKFDAQTSNSRTRRPLLGDLKRRRFESNVPGGPNRV